MMPLRKSARWSSENVKASRALTVARIEATSKSNLADRQLSPCGRSLAAVMFLAATGAMFSPMNVGF